MYEAMSTISWSYSAAGAGDAKASPAEACTMVVEKARAVVCRADGREEKEEVEDLVLCWATNLELVRSGALTMLLLLRAAAARAKLRLAMALIAGAAVRMLLEGRGEERTRERRRLLYNDFSMATGGRKKVG
jgi:hypothetical protein